MSMFCKALAFFRRRARATYGIVSSARKLERATNAIMWLDLRSVQGFSARWGKSVLAQQLAQCHEIQDLKLLCARVRATAASATRTQDCAKRISSAMWL